MPHCLPHSQYDAGKCGVDTTVIIIYNGYNMNGLTTTGMLQKHIRQISVGSFSVKPKDNGGNIGWLQTSGIGPISACGCKKGLVDAKLTLPTVTSNTL